MTLVKIGEASEMLGVSIQTLRAWEASGELIPDRRSTGGTRYYDPSRIAGLIRQPEPPTLPSPEPSLLGAPPMPPEPLLPPHQPPVSFEPSPLATPGLELGGAVRAACDVPLSAEAATLFREFAGDVEEETGPGGEFGSIPLFVKLLPEIAAYLGATIADNRDHGFTELSLEDFQSGILIACDLATEAKKAICKATAPA
jgi:hypothetical protein